MRHGAARVKLDVTAADKLRPLAKFEGGEASELQ